MTTTAENILNQALTLDDSERAQLAERLWQSVEPAPTDLTDEQKAMLDRRWEEITSGKVQTQDGFEVLAKLRAKYGI
jgi:putative addiction module component (TIGR02574 family)